MPYPTALATSRRTPHSAYLQGFTFIEILMVVGVLFLLGATMLPAFLNFYLRNQLELETKQITITLRSTQGRAISRENESYWGIHFVNALSGNDYFEVFSNTSTPAYASSGVVSVSYFPAGVALQTPSAGNTQDIIFNQVSGTAVLGSATIVLQLARDATVTRVIMIGTNGLISSLPSLAFTLAYGK